jgi:hypothetical protein
METVRAVLLLVCIMGLSAVGKTQSKPTNAETPLSMEELKLYGDFLDTFLGTHGESRPVGLSERTVSLILSPEDADGCLKGIEFKISKAADQYPHSFPMSITKARPVYLVDPSKKKITEMQGGLLSLSEIGFDDDHRFAVIKFSLVQSGFLVRQGTRVFSKSNGKWTRTNRPCPEWFS